MFLSSFFSLWNASLNQTDSSCIIQPGDGEEKDDDHSQELHCENAQMKKKTQPWNENNSLFVFCFAILNGTFLYLSPTIEHIQE